MAEETHVVEENKIPEDMYEVEIFPHLPAKKLQTLKTVSKDWYRLITSPYFVRLHQSTGYRSRIRVLTTYPSEMIEYNNYDDDEETKRIPYPPQFSSMQKFSGSSVEIVGSADGLICMFDRKADFVGGHGLLFNPSTGKCLELWPYSPEFYMILCSWFGSVDGEYVLVMGAFSAGPGYEFGVYKLTSSKLKRIYSTFVDLQLDCFRCLDRGTLVDGVVHWPIRRVINQQTNYAISAYHLYDNKQWVMSPPVQRDFRLGVLDGCLFAILKKVVGVFEVWVMKESWNKCAEIEGFEDDYKVLTPLGCFPNGDLVLDVDESMLMRYSFSDKVAVLIMDYDCSRYQAVMCADTLVSPSI